MLDRITPSPNQRFEDPSIDRPPTFAEDVPAYVLVTEHASGVDLLEYTHVVIKARVQRTDLRRTQSMRLCPVWLASMASHDALKLAEEAAVGHVECVRSVRLQLIRLSSTELLRKMKSANVLVLHDANPAHAFTVAGAHPDVVGVRETHLDWEVRTEAVWISEFLVEPFAQGEETLAGVLQRDRPFRGELRVLNKQTRKERTRAPITSINGR